MEYVDELKNFDFVPFLGDLFSIGHGDHYPSQKAGGFRPLSRGLFFNNLQVTREILRELLRFRPLSRGLFFNAGGCHHHASIQRVFVPFFEDFFSIGVGKRGLLWKAKVFVPFLGDFFSMSAGAAFNP